MKYVPYVTSAKLLVVLSLMGIAYFGYLFTKGNRIVDLYSAVILVFICVYLLAHLRGVG